MTSPAAPATCRREKVTEQVVVGTHGKLHQWMNRRLLPARNLRILVFDEADEMLKVCEGTMHEPVTPTRKVSGKLVHCSPA